MPDVAMPRLSDSMEEGTIVKWLKSDGDDVHKGEELVEIETDKANMTYEADDEGTLSIVAKEGDTLPVGETIARIGEGASGGGDASDAGGESASDAAEPRDGGEEAQGEGGEGGEGGDGAGASAEPPSDQQPEPVSGAGEPEPAGDDAQEATAGGEPPAQDAPAGDPSGNGDGGDRIKASPVARRLAGEAGVELQGLEGSGPGGRIVKADVEAAAKGGGPRGDEAPDGGADGESSSGGEQAAPEPEAKPAAPAAGGASGGGTAKGETEIQELSRLQQLVARRMAESKATAPDFHLTVEVDMEAAIELRKELRVAAIDRTAPSFNDFVVKACALALRDFPRANGAYRDGRFELYSRVNVGIAVAGQDALVVPTIFDADRKSLGEIARDARGLAGRVRDGKITPPELSGGTFTVSNLGMYGIRRFVAVINPPQAAILSVGALEPRAVVRDGEVVARATMELTLACDHRILYGAEAAEFLSKIRERLEQPLSLAL